VSLIHSDGLQERVKRDAVAMRAALTPPTVENSATTFESLQAVYAQDKADEMAHRVLSRVWCDALAEIPYAIQKIAFKQRTQSPSPFMPKPGEFLEICEKLLAEKTAITRRAERLAEEIENGTLEREAEEIAAASRTDESKREFSGLGDVLRKMPGRKKTCDMTRGKASCPPDLKKGKAEK